MKALLVGYGKMGKAIEAVLLARGHTIAGRIGRGDRGTEEVCAEIAFEFTTPVAAPGLVSSYLSKKTPVLSGTTGWDVEPARRLALELGVAFLHSANFSLGVAALRQAVAAVAAALAPFPEFEPGIVERHHSQKKDAPSGTAKLLAADVEAARPGRPPVPVVSLRQGAQPGEHLVLFEGENEVVELVHRARSRAIFAGGAVHAAEWMLSAGRRGPLTFEEFIKSSVQRRQP